MVNEDRCPRCGRSGLIESCWNGKAECCGYCGYVIRVFASDSEEYYEKI